jgi:protein pelota
MRILYHNLKEGKIKVQPETLDDLWYLKTLIKEGDLVSGRSYRRVRDEEKLRADKGVRVPVFLEIRVENTELAKYINRLRVTGTIEHGPEDLITLGAFHTIEVEPNDAITIVKEKWRRWELERLREAEKAGITPLVLIACLEEGEAEFVMVRRYGLDFVARVTTTIPGKRVVREHEASLRQFYTEVSGKIEEVLEKEDIRAIVICGPGFAKDNLLAYLKEKHPRIAGICYVESTGTGGRAGIQEVLKRGVIERIVKESRVSLETKLVEQLFVEIGKDSGLATYGIEEVKKAIEYGAVEKLLITDALLRVFEGSDRLIEKTRQMRGKAIVVSTEHEAGERLQWVGGIAALLRFKVG